MLSRKATQSLQGLPDKPPAGSSSKSAPTAEFLYSGTKHSCPGGVLLSRQTHPRRTLPATTRPTALPFRLLPRTSIPPTLRSGFGECSAALRTKSRKRTLKNRLRWRPRRTRMSPKVHPPCPPSPLFLHSQRAQMPARQLHPRLPLLHRLLRHHMHLSIHQSCTNVL
jgi:hypothetical protein